VSFIGCYWGGGGERVGLGVNGEKTEYVFMYIKHNAGPYESKSVGNVRTEFHPDPARKLYDIYHCCVYSENLLMMDRGTVRNM